MSRGLSQSDQLLALLLVVVMVLSIPTAFVTAAATAPIEVSDDTAVGDDPTDNSTAADTTADSDTSEADDGEASADSTGQDASALKRADAALAEQSGDATIARSQLELARELLTIGEGSSASQREQTLDVTDALLEQRKAWAASEKRPLPSSTVSSIEATQTKLDGARKLLETNDDLQDADGLTRAVTLAKQGTKLQAAQADDSVTLSSDLPAVETPNHESPSGATLALLDRYGITPTAEDVATMRELDNQPEPYRSELTDFLDVYLAFQTATAQGDTTGIFAARNQLLDETQDLNVALENTDQPGIVTPQHESDASVGHTQNIPNTTLNSTIDGFTPDNVHASAGVNTTVETAGKYQVGCVNVKHTRASGDLKAYPFGQREDFDPKNASGTWDNETNHFCALQIGKMGAGGQTYDDNTIVLIDHGGDDTYDNNAGGTNLDDNCDGPIDLKRPPSNNFAPTNNNLDAGVAAALVDLGQGADDYTRSTAIGCGQRGGGHLGSGFLVDQGGSDEYGTYSASHQATNGGGYAVLTDDSKCCVGAVATGFLLDAGSRDNQNVGAISGGQGDEFRAGGFGTNGGAIHGSQFDPRLRAFGFLLDVDGNSTYKATVRGVNGGGASRGVGFLANLGNNTKNNRNIYKAEHSGTNGGAKFQSKPGGMLIDANGTDKYHATSGGTNGGGAAQSTGFLLDAGTNNQSRANPEDNFTTGHAFDDTLHDAFSFEAGPRARQAGFQGVNGGAKEDQSVGLLVDVAGPSLYKAGDGQGANGGGYELGVGNLVDGSGAAGLGADGDDTYISGYDPQEGTEWKNQELEDHPPVEFPSIATNGGGAAGGVGAVVDLAGTDRFEARDGHFGGVNATNGGGYFLGAGGVGFVANNDGKDTYAAYSNTTGDDTSDTVGPDSGPVTGANGGGSGYGDVTLTSGSNELFEFIPGVRNPQGPALRATGTLVDNGTVDSPANGGAVGHRDEYVVTTDTSEITGEPIAGSNGGAYGLTSTGLLVDQSGDNEKYEADAANNTTLGVNGGVRVDNTTFTIDPVDSDSFNRTAQNDTLNQTVGGNLRQIGNLVQQNVVIPTEDSLAVGLLLDGAGTDDSYKDDYCSQNWDDDTIIGKGYGALGKNSGTAGAQIDNSSAGAGSGYGCGSNPL